MANPIAILDLCGEVCPFPAMYVGAKLERMSGGEALEVLVDHLCAVEGVPAAVAQLGHKVLSVGAAGSGVYRIVIQVMGPEKVRRSPS